MSMRAIADRMSDGKAMYEVYSDGMRRRSTETLSTWAELPHDQQWAWCDVAERDRPDACRYCDDARDNLMCEDCAQMRCTVTFE